MVIIFIIALLVIQALLFLFHFTFYKTLLSVFALANPSLLIALKIALAVLSVSFVITSLLASRYTNATTRILYTISATWLGFLFYFFLAACAYNLGILLGIQSAFFGKALVFSAVLVGIYGILHAKAITVTSLKVNLPNLPASWNGKRVAWISDLHLGQIHGKAFAARVAAMTQELHPDVIFIGGDLYDGVAVDIKKVIEPIAALRAPWGVYFVTGNHEEFFDSEKYVAAIRAAGITTLINETIDIHGVSVIGVDYKDASNKTRYADLLEELTANRKNPRILLKHDPMHLAVAEKAGVDLEISGHTHQLQMFPLGFITRLIYKGFDYGLHRFGSMLVYTSSGVGTWGPPLRVGTRSEIVLFEFVN